MKEFLNGFFAQLGINLTSLEIHEEENDISIRVETPDSSLLIGMHGKNREALEHLFGRVAEKMYNRFVHVHLEVNDYLKLKEEKLFSFLEYKITLIMESGKRIEIKNLSSFERKKAHNYIAEKKIN